MKVKNLKIQNYKLEDIFYISAADGQIKLANSPQQNKYYYK